LLRIPFSLVKALKTIKIMKTLCKLFASLLILVSISVKAQNLTQTIKGRVLDKISQTSLPGATLMVMGTNPAIATVADFDGSFRLEKVPVVRHIIEVRFVGYAPVIIPEVLVGSGKEIVLNIEMIESFGYLSHQQG
jgi:hypothetical protein